MKRRKFLQYGALSGLGILGGSYLYKFATNHSQEYLPSTAASVENAVRRTSLFIPGNSGLLGILDISGAKLTLSARSTTLPLIQGKQSPFLIYEAQYGDKVYVNPTIRVKRGNQFSARLQNDLDQPTIIHWHGLHLPGVMDGHPRTTIGTGAHYDYAFTVANRGGMYWYHTHAHNLTAKQAFFGLAGIFMVEDDDEAALRTALKLEPGKTELPLLIQDKQFNSMGELAYADNSMQQMMMGQLGDTILVNLTPQPQLDIANRLYRFRVLNGSNSRIYKLAFVQGGKVLPYVIIGTDAGLLDQSHTVQQMFLAPAERMDILFDASQLRTGDDVFLKSLAFDAMNDVMMSGMGGMTGGMSGMGEPVAPASRSAPNSRS